jgi:Flp pilus assembly protein TadD
VANDPPEVMCVFAWDPLRTHLVPARVADLTRAAEAALAAGNAPDALRALREALSIDKASARVWLRLGDALARSGPSEQATQAWKRARALFPDSPDVARRLASVADSAATTAH